MAKKKSLEDYKPSEDNLTNLGPEYFSQKKEYFASFEKKNKLLENKPTTESKQNAKQEDFADKEKDPNANLEEEKDRLQREQEQSQKLSNSNSSENEGEGQSSDSSSSNSSSNSSQGNSSSSSSSSSSGSSSGASSSGASASGASASAGAAGAGAGAAAAVGAVAAVVVVGGAIGVPIVETSSSYISEPTTSSVVADTSSSEVTTSSYEDSTSSSAETSSSETTSESSSEVTTSEETVVALTMPDTIVHIDSGTFVAYIPTSNDAKLVTPTDTSTGSKTYADYMIAIVQDQTILNAVTIADAINGTTYYGLTLGDSYEFLIIDTITITSSTTLADCSVYSSFDPVAFKATQYSDLYSHVGISEVDSSLQVMGYIYDANSTYASYTVCASINGLNYQYQATSTGFFDASSVFTSSGASTNDVAVSVSVYGQLSTETSCHFNSDRLVEEVTSSNTMLSRCMSYFSSTSTKTISTNVNVTSDTNDTTTYSISGTFLNFSSSDTTTYDTVACYMTKGDSQYTDTSELMTASTASSVTVDSTTLSFTAESSSAWTESLKFYAILDNVITGSILYVPNCLEAT